MKNRRALRSVATLSAFGLVLQLVVPPMAWASHTLPGGTSPGRPDDSGGEQEPSNNPSEEDQEAQDDVDPVDLHRGDFTLSREDVVLPGRGLSIAFARRYRSQSAYNGPLGYGWDFSYNRRLYKLDSGNMVWLSGANRQDEFAYDAQTGTYAPPPGVYVSLVQNVDGTWTLTDAHGQEQRYDADGKLTAIVDRNGNTLSFAYDPAGRLPIEGPSDYFVNQTTGVIARDFRLTTMTDPAERQLVFTYNADGRIETITDWTSRTWRYTYDADGYLTQVTTPATPEFPQGTTTTYTYTADHNLETITDAKNQVYLTNAYEATTDQLTSQTYGTGTSRIIYGEDANGNATADVTDRRGFRTLYIFDEAGHITQIEQFTDGDPPGEPPSYITTYAYNADGERIQTVLPRGNSIEWTYDSANPDPKSRGNLLELRRKPLPGSTEPDLVTSFTYETQFNQIKTLTDPRGNVTTYTYDYELDPGDPDYGEAGNLVKITYPTVDNITPTVRFTYTSFGQLETITDPNGNVTTYTYNTNGYLSTITQGFGTPQAATTTLLPDSIGNITSIKNANNASTLFAYNALNQLMQVTAPVPFNFQTYYTYDANGNLIQIDRQAVTTPPGPRPQPGFVDPEDDWQSTVYTYTLLDRLETITNDLSDVTRFAYDANGNRTSITDPLSRLTSYDYDERDLLMTVTDAATPAGLTQYTYDANGHLTTITDANTNPTTYAYDDFDRLEQTTYADSSFETYAYDEASNLIQKITPENQLLDYVYDALNRLREKHAPEETTTYTYDAGSRLATAEDADAKLTYTYDALNRVTQVVTDPFTPNVPTTTVRYGYDKVGNRTTLRYPNNLTLTSTYDALNRLDVIRIGATLLGDYDYDALSRRTRLARASGVLTTTYTYDAINRLLQVFHDAPGAMSPEAEALAEVPELTTDAEDTGVLSPPSTLNSQLTVDGGRWSVDASASQTLVDSTIAYTYDEVGNRKDRVDASGLHLYTYDALDQLTGANYPEGFAVGDTTYTYDAVGNRTRVNSTPYSPNSLNQYTQVGPTPLTWSPNGNLTNDGSNTYTYDSENRLTSAIPASGSVSFTYDPFGRRLSKTTTTGTTRFLYDGDQLIADTTSTGSITQLYLYGPGLDEPLLMTRGSQRYFYLADGLGSITALTSLSGQTVESYTYDVYGRPLQPSTLGNRFRFTGREYDAETQLYYYRARYYHPTLGRFVSRDPLTWGPNDPRIFTGYTLDNRIQSFLPLTPEIQDVQSPLMTFTERNVLQIAGSLSLLQHPYLYVANNPVNRTDPLGLWYIDFNFGVGSPWFIGGTGGIIISPEGIYGYAGGGLVTPGPSGSLTWSPMDVVEGWTGGIQFVGGISYQGGYSFAQEDGEFGEIGLGWPLGLAATIYYVDELWQWPWEQDKK